ncbi:MAG: Fe-S oxidoreductase [Leucobacter sp.]
MQLGARWRTGEPPHRGVPPLLHETIAGQERCYPEAGSWTLTWLEGRPRCTLDDAVLVSLDAKGGVIVRELGAGFDSVGVDGAGIDNAGIDRSRSAAAEAEADDDDWLS